MVWLFVLASLKMLHCSSDPSPYHAPAAPLLPKLKLPAVNVFYYLKAILISLKNNSKLLSTSLPVRKCALSKPRIAVPVQDSLFSICPRQIRACSRLEKFIQL